MTQRILLSIFFFCLSLCSSIILTFIWGEGPSSEFAAKAAAVSFVIGLASFLVWFVFSLVYIKDAIDRGVFAREN